MGSKKDKKADFVSERDKRKLEIAEELGFGEKLKESGWASLTSKETGAIGARMGIKKN